MTYLYFLEMNFVLSEQQISLLISTKVIYEIMTVRLNVLIKFNAHSLFF